MSGCWINRFLTHFKEHNFAIKGAKVDSLLSTPQSWTSFMCLSCLFWTFVTYLSWKSDVPPNAKHHQSFFACSNTTPHGRRSFFIIKHTEKPAHTLLRKDPPTRLAVHHLGPPHASHVPRKQGARHWGPYVLMPLILSMHLSSIHHICTPPHLPSPGPHHVLTKAASQRKEKAEKERRIQPLPCRTVLAEVPSIVPGPASPRLVSPKNTPSSPRKQQPHCWGDGTWGVLLSKGV